ncbi:DUF2231 domain-containing protein [Micromonospora cremea]|uniref:DUF2231 domain-containing protein n=1 Tax=Micromonospora cremea TaxID=709881 RepID=A0A1N6BDJ6_9ACTN|nr:DUF2231 domain-containing protein [Micromonospora cremea]SIN44401.1 hypothetical protein SAMN04489832_7244 [Micromonospora cremea]
MFEEFQGLPLHPLFVHVPIVFVPLLVIGAAIYALVPRLRRPIGWAVLLLAISAPLSTLLAVESGEALKATLAAKGYPPETLAQVSEHQHNGEMTRSFTFGLGVSTLLLLLLVTSGHPRVVRLPSWVRLLLSAVVLVFCVLTAVYVLRTGDSGSEAVWTGVV